MTRSVEALLVLVAVVGVSVAWSGCNSPNCGAGTKQVQAADGTLSCVLADVPKQLIQCDVDGGTAEIVGGVCQSRVKCDPSTTGFDPATGICVGTGGGGGCAVTCKPPGPGKICVTGNLYDFATGTAFKKGDKTVRVAAYEPLAFLSNPNGPSIQETIDDNGCYAFSDITLPSSGLIAILSTDPTGNALEFTAAGTQTMAAGKTYKVDVYVTEKTVIDGWKTQTGKDWDLNGIYLAEYFDLPVPDATNLRIPDDNKPVMGVKITDSGTVVAAANYFDTRSTMMTSLTATSAIGFGAVFPDASISIYSGNGGMCSDGMGGMATCKWDVHPGGSAPHVLFVDRFHNCLLSPTAPSCM